MPPAQQLPGLTEHCVLPGSQLGGRQLLLGGPGGCAQPFREVSASGHAVPSSCLHAGGRASRGAAPGFLPAPPDGTLSPSSSSSKALCQLLLQRGHPPSQRTLFTWGIILAPSHAWERSILQTSQNSALHHQTPESHYRGTDERNGGHEAKSARQGHAASLTHRLEGHGRKLVHLT